VDGFDQNKRAAEGDDGGEVLAVYALDRPLGLLRLDYSHKIGTVDGADNNCLLSFARKERPKVCHVHNCPRRCSSSGHSQAGRERYYRLPQANYSRHQKTALEVDFRVNLRKTRSGAQPDL
jgi:hypothetical protein